MQYTKNAFYALIDNFREEKSNFQFSRLIKKRFLELENKDHSPEAILIAECLLQSSKAKRPFTLIDDGNCFYSSRQNLSDCFVSPILFFPRHLLTINWGGFFLGNQWIEKYHSFHVKEKEAIIVTASLDSEDMYGYCDFVIDIHKSSDCQSTNMRNIGASIVREWANLHYQYNQSCWSDIVDSGLISEEMAVGMSYGVDW
ncbi:hypothetical protein OAP51_02655 [Alphaproteobacteria bacterium]|nr:hypothetical protein [Alphaproteobacteria bacterium]